MNEIISCKIFRSIGIEKIKVELLVAISDVEKGELVRRMNRSLFGVIDQCDKDGKGKSTRLRRSGEFESQTDLLILILASITIISWRTETCYLG